MRIFVFTRHYPVPYKPYYDTQFADLIGSGHDVTIWSGGALDHVVNEKVIRFGLAQRTRLFPTTLRTLPRFAVPIAGRLASHPRWSVRRAYSLWRECPSPKRWFMNWARALVLGPASPELCIIHGMGTAVLFPFLRTLYPAAASALYYHGGDPPGVAELNLRETSQAFASVDRVFSNTEFSCRHAIDRGCPADRIEVLPVGFAIKDFNPPVDRSYRRGGTLNLFSAGRMSEEKGFIYSLHALKQLVDRGMRDVTYSLTGEGYLRPQLEAYVEENGLSPYVRFLGTLSTEQVIESMLSADVLLLPSVQVGNWVENQACAVQEALLLKAVVITTTTGGVPESIPGAMRRFSVPPGEADSLAEAIASVIDLRESELMRLGEQGRDFVVQNYDVRRLNDRLIGSTIKARRARSRSRSTATQPIECFADGRQGIVSSKHLPS